MNEVTVRQKNPYALWFVVASFIVPVVLAYGYYFSGGKPLAGNNGVLISPVIDVESLVLTDRDGQLLPRDKVTRKWRLLMLVDKKCDQSCQDRLYLMRQTHVALGKNAYRFARMLVHLDKAESELDDLIASEYPHAQRVYSHKTEALKAFGLTNDTLLNNSIYVMDPIGNIMMFFSSEIPPKLILKDLKRLLKISMIG